MNSTKLVFKLQSAEQGDILTALFSHLNMDGSEQNELEWIAYFPSKDFDEVEIQKIITPFALTYTKEIIEPQNWNALWESNFEPILINDQVGVRAHFHPPFENCQYDIEITPKMSFGTGHHETTRMMLQYVSELDCNNLRVFDFGCGTGVLAILAKLKSAGYTAGIDNDDWSVENAIENCTKNHCESIEISKNTLQDFESTFDLILANINLNVLLNTLPRLKEMLTYDGNLYLSGILDSDLTQMQEKINSLGFTIISSKQIKNWMALHIKNNNI